MPNLSGETLGPYRILESLGQGGMATVYKGYHTRLDHYVAIKVLASFLADEPGFHERFRQEGVVLARLRHPHIVTVHDAAEDRGYAYMVTDYVDGGSLADRAGKPMPVDEAVRLLMPIASALDFAHARSVLHRDVKPSNILLWKDGTPVLADFGISRLAEGTTRLTRTGMVVGTPEYMAPELAMEGQAGPAADQYALAIVAYELLTGRVPFRMETPLGVLMAQAQQAPPPPRSINPALDPAVEAAVMKGLAKRPEDRFPDVEAFVGALAVAGGQAVPPPRVPAPGAAETVVEMAAITGQQAAAPVSPPPASTAGPGPAPAPAPGAIPEVVPAPSSPIPSPPPGATEADAGTAGATISPLPPIPQLAPLPQLQPVTFGEMKPVPDVAPVAPAAQGAQAPAAGPPPSTGAPAPPAASAPSRPAIPAGAGIPPAAGSAAPSGQSPWVVTPTTQPGGGIPTIAILAGLIVLLLILVVAASRLLHISLVSGASAPTTAPTPIARSGGAPTATAVVAAPTIAPTVTAASAVPTAAPPTAVPATAVPASAVAATPLALLAPGQPAAAGGITPGGQPVQVTITTPGQKQRLTFQGAAGQRVSLRAKDNTIGDVQVSIFRPEGQSVTSSSFGGDGFLDTAKLPVAGAYAIEVAPLQASAGGVSLTLYDVPPDVASPITPGGSPVQATLTTPGQKARLPLQGTAGQRVSMKITENTIGDVQVQILRPEGQAVGGTAVGGDGFIDTVKLPVAGTYTVVVAPLGPTIGGITLTPYTVPADVATPISPGGPAVPVSLTVPGQKGRLPFTGSAGQKVSLQVSQNTLGDVQVQIVRPDGQNLTGTATGGDAQVDAVALPLAGPYVVTVAPLGPNIGSVTVTLHVVP